MTALVLIWSLKSIYNQNIDTIVVSNIRTTFGCQALGNKLTQDLKKINPEIEVTFTCEEL